MKSCQRDMNERFSCRRKRNGKEDIMKIRKGLGKKKERIERKSDDSEDEAKKYWKIVKVYASGGVKEMLQYFG